MTEPTEAFRQAVLALRRAGYKVHRAGSRRAEVTTPDGERAVLTNAQLILLADRLDG